MKKVAVFICLAALALVGCQSKVTGTLEVDGSPFAVQQCRSGQAFGFSGIELTDDAGRRRTPLVAFLSSFSCSLRLECYMLGWS